jgi:hypothetical protein
MLARIPSQSNCTLRWYCNRTIFAHLAMQNAQFAFGNIDLNNPNKIPNVALQGIPVRLATTLVSTEALVGGTAGAPA